MKNNLFRYWANAFLMRAYAYASDERPSFQLVFRFGFGLHYDTADTEFVLDYDESGFHVFGKPSILSYILRFDTAVRPFEGKTADIPPIEAIEQTFLEHENNRQFWMLVETRKEKSHLDHVFSCGGDPSLWSRVPRYSKSGFPLTALYWVRGYNLLLSRKYEFSVGNERLPLWRPPKLEEVKRVIELSGGDDPYGIVEKWDLITERYRFIANLFEEYYEWYKTRYQIRDDDGETKAQIRRRFELLSDIFSPPSTMFSGFAFYHVEFMKHASHMSNIRSYFELGYLPRNKR
jgi:hypothetical protein